MILGKRMKEKRLELGLTLEEVATKVGKNRTTIYRYETGELGNMPLSLLEPIANALGTTPIYLMGWEEHEDGSIKLIDNEFLAFQEVANLIGYTSDLTNRDIERMKTALKLVLITE